MCDNELTVGATPTLSEDKQRGRSAMPMRWADWQPGAPNPGERRLVRVGKGCRSIPTSHTPRGKR